MEDDLIGNNIKIKSNLNKDELIGRLHQQKMTSMGDNLNEGLPKLMMDSEEGDLNWVKPN